VVAPVVSGLEIEYGQATDPGLDPAKRVNEDACAYAETPIGHLFVLCDGMGGHAGGKQASDIAVRTVLEVASRGGDPGGTLVEAIREAGRRVYEFGGPATNKARPGSTVVALLLHHGVVDVAHVGDSRAYAIRGKQIYRLTRDHSMVQELLDGGVINEQEAIGHPDSNKITRALGMTPQVEVERRGEPMELYDGDIFVLASDGLTDLARNDDILVTVTEYLKEKNVQAVCDELVALANRRGGHDNITVQVIRVVGAGQRGQTITQEPPLQAPLAGAPVQATLEGMPHIAATVVQRPSFDAPPGRPIATTAPDPPSPTIVDPTLDQPPPIPPTNDEPQNQMLIYVVMAMAGVIGLLLALLVWALMRQ
jgi:PPM family protein phosphatase